MRSFCYEISVIVLLEEFGCNFLQVDTPVAPHVAATIDIHSVLQAIAFEKLLQNEGAGICEVGIATANLIEFVAGLLDSLQLLVHLGGILCAADTHTSYIMAYKFTLSPLFLFSFLFTALFVLFKTPIYANYSNTPNNLPPFQQKAPDLHTRGRAGVYKPSP